jgi:hypothetical protein
MPACTTKTAALRGDVIRQPVELAEGGAGLVAQEKADVVGRRIETADEIGG